MLATLLPHRRGPGRDLRPRRRTPSPTSYASCSASPGSTPRSTRTSPPPRTSGSSRGSRASARTEARTPRRRAARAVRPHRGGDEAHLRLLRRHAPAPRPRRQPDHPAAADLPRRAHHGPRPAHPRADVGHDPRPGPRRAARSCSPRSTSTRPTSSPTGSPSSTAAARSPRAPPTSSSRRSGSSALQLQLADPADLPVAADVVRAAGRRGAGPHPRGRRVNVAADPHRPGRRRPRRAPRPRDRHRVGDRPEAVARRGLPRADRPRHPRRHADASRRRPTTTSTRWRTPDERHDRHRPRRHRRPADRASACADTVSQTMTLAWRATMKMRRSLEVMFDVTIQPLIFTGDVRLHLRRRDLGRRRRATCRSSSPASSARPC